MLISALRRLDPEHAHRLAILGLRLGLAPADHTPDDPALAVGLWGERFPNPIGLAAGFDKDAKALRGLARLGFGYLEAGTVTPLLQPGQARPRVFRLEQDGAVINRYGLNNAGLDAFAARLARLPAGLRVAANIGPNAGTALEDHLPALVAAVALHACYIAINVSSPNTPGLRDLQGERRLAALLALATRGRHPPILVKIAPDLAPGALETIVETAVDGGAAGLIVANTTVARDPGLHSPARHERGGLSGRPLLAPSTRLLADTARLARGRLTLIGCGGVATGADAFAKICAGATLVQLYTAFAYAGPALIPRLKRELLVAMQTAGIARITDAVGAAL